MLEKQLGMNCIFTNSLLEVVKTHCRCQWSIRRWIELQHRTLHCSTVYNDTVQFSTLQYSAVQSSVVQGGVVRFSVVQCSAMLSSQDVLWPQVFLWTQAWEGGQKGGLQCQGSTRLPRGWCISSVSSCLLPNNVRRHNWCINVANVITMILVKKTH